MKCCLVGLFFFAGPLALPSTGQAQLPPSAPSTKLLASDGGDFDNFGISVAVSGNTAVVGARFDDTSAGGNAGSAYVFVRTGGVWTQQQKLTAPDGAGEDAFGVSVGIAGETIIVGAYRGDTPGGIDAGAAYVFLRSGGTW